jgi:vacuolar-type H+-ATPase subunit F/Vma7
MATVVALGDSRELDGFALAGARVMVACDDDVVAAWHDLDDEVGLVILTDRAARLLSDELVARPDVLTAVLP